MLKICLAVILVTCVSSFVLPDSLDYYGEDEETYRPPGLIRKRADPEKNTKLCGIHLLDMYKKGCVKGIKPQQEFGPREELRKFLGKCCDFGCSAEKLKEYICEK